MGEGVDHERLEGAIEEVVAALPKRGDPSERGMAETPRRVAEAYELLFSGLTQDPERCLKEAFEGGYRDLVLMRDIPLYSVCEHHLLPFVGKAHVGYLPDGKVLGLSEIARVVEIFARRPQLQERLTAQVADLLYESLGSRGSMVVIEAEQLCMTMRGVQKPGSTTVTSASRGLYEEDATERAQLMDLISAARR